MQRTAALWLVLVTLATGVAAISYGGFIEEAQELPQPSILRGDDLPYAYRVSSVFHLVASVHEREGKDSPGLRGVLTTLGLEAGSPAARHLVQLAVELEAHHPYVTPQTDLEAFGTDYEAVNAYLDKKENQRLEALGEALGRWLLDCEADSLAIEPLLDRLLNGTHLSAALFSTDEPQAELRRAAGVKVEFFERGLLGTLGKVPRRLEWKP